KDYTEVKGNQTYVAVYEKTTNKYTVKWVDEDGTTLIDQKDYEYGAIPKFEGVEPTKATDAQYTYTFKGWDKDYTEVKGNQTYVAVYEKTTNKYTVKWVDEDGTTLIDQKDYEYGATVEVIKTVPTREGYKFSGWRSEEVTIENDAFTMPAKDVVLKAVWEANPTPTPIPSEEPTPTPAPNPNPNPNPATPTPTPVAPVVPATVATPTPKPTATPSTTPSDNGGKGDGNNDGEIGETINDNETPLANGEDIADNATPLAGLGTGAWALINLILTIVTTLLSILLLIGYIGKKKKALEDEDGNVVLDENGKEVMEYEKNKKGLWRLISIIPALIAIIVFIFTEDMTLPMIFVDKWTILHVVIALVQVVVMVLCKKRKDENDEDENAANA
uniref:InlB B-repeat-containing protein n=1 Tax=Hominenteromicrobium sp. TaxID=3073581 RepID=UPI003A904F86